MTVFTNICQIMKKLHALPCLFFFPWQSVDSNFYLYDILIRAQIDMIRTHRYQFCRNMSKCTKFSRSKKKSIANTSLWTNWYFLAIFVDLNQSKVRTWWNNSRISAEINDLFVNGRDLGTYLNRMKRALQATCGHKAYLESKWEVKRVGQGEAISFIIIPVSPVSVTGASV